MKNEMTSKERVKRAISGNAPDRVPLSDSYWQTTVDRWNREGLPPSVSPSVYFGTDEILYLSGDYTMRFPERVLDQDRQYRTYWDADGALRKDLHTPDGWTSQWLDFTIKTRADWEKHRHRLQYDESRLLSSTVAAYEKGQSAGKFICFTAHACFHPTWMRIGMENELVKMLDDPDLINELFSAHVDLVIDIFLGLESRGIEFDGVRLADDLAYRTSSLVSPETYRQAILPHHGRLCAHFKERGLPVILHSDGHIVPLFGLFLQAGFDGFHPLEVKAGMDIRTLRAEYGDGFLAFGNIDARALAGTREEIEAEITSTLSVAMETGRYIFHSDHSVPQNVSFDNYQYAMELVKKVGRYR